MELRSRFAYKNPLYAGSTLNTHMYYTYTSTRSSVHYDPQTATWVEGESDLGDIAPHKVQAGVNVPVRPNWNLFLSGNYVSGKKLYLRNPLRWADRDLDGDIVVNCILRFRYEPWTVALQVNNLFDREYFHAGVESADAGDDFSNRSLGFYNSLHAQPGRSFVFRLGIQY